MNNQKPGILVPALVGGGLAGLLSGIPLINCLCCVWVIGGAVLSSFLLSRNSPVSLTGGDGAIVGIFTGIIAAVVDAIISIPFQAINARIVQRVLESIAQYSEEMPPQWETWLKRGGAETTFAMFMLGLVISVFIFAALGALGGIIGVAIFGKKPGEKKGSEGATDVPKDTGDRQS
ncbi:hypothetical protein KGY73_00855 [bacterium]|nr:hypothetical protein [bacterium]